MTLASVLIPTFDHASTLGLSVDSALAQSTPDLEVLIVGDGVTDDVRAVALDLAKRDSRVRFFDFPKGPHHGEVHRHTAIQQSTGDNIFYLCDDDLFLPGHVAELSHLLHTHDFVQSLNGHIDIGGAVQFYTGDLADAWYVARLSDLDISFNFVSITGTAHTRAFYERAAAPWETTPAGIWPDRYQWKRMLRAADTQAMTSLTMTAIAFPTHLGREAWSAEERAAEVARWAAVVAQPTAQDHIDHLVATSAIQYTFALTKHALQLQDRIAAADHRFATVTGSRWWRLGRRIRPGIRGREA